MATRSKEAEKKTATRIVIPHVWQTLQGVFGTEEINNATFPAIISAYVSALKHAESVLQARIEKESKFVTQKSEVELMSAAYRRANEDLNRFPKLAKIKPGVPFADIVAGYGSVSLSLALSDFKGGNLVIRLSNKIFPEPLQEHHFPLGLVDTTPSKTSEMEAKKAGKMSMEGLMSVNHVGIYLEPTIIIDSKMSPYSLLVAGLADRDDWGGIKDGCIYVASSGERSEENRNEIHFHRFEKCGWNNIGGLAKLVKRSFYEAETGGRPFALPTSPAHLIGNLEFTIVSKKITQKDLSEVISSSFSLYMLALLDHKGVEGFNFAGSPGYAERHLLKYLNLPKQRTAATK